jgi:hypothetical protein
MLNETYRHTGLADGCCSDPLCCLQRDSTARGALRPAPQSMGYAQSVSYVVSVMSLLLPMVSARAAIGVAFSGDSVC